MLDQLACLAAIDGDQVERCVFVVASLCEERDAGAVRSPRDAADADLSGDERSRLAGV